MTETAFRLAIPIPSQAQPEQELIMDIRYKVEPPRSARNIEVQCIAGDTVTLDLAALNGYELELLSISKPSVGQQMVEGTRVTFTPPAGFQGDVVVTYDARQKIGPPRVV